ncbi:hypothetical protein M413DRAFT_147301 [Hebeloma cylindrosporum]|uniref:USP domain-containing protein n=1 Tax=Hebeloma cylindrosporum TaxID=76867 RepID=A0A0C3CAX8_HEBCY|nr:hypothetical protein M413DRAFT_147301 [Hebeloma cylindrosporum h7]
MQLTSESEQVENEQVDLCISIVPGVDASIARRVLRKHKGDIQKAVDALLAGDRGSNVWESKHRTTPEPFYVEPMETTTAVIPLTATAPSSVIDLTGDEDDMTRALQMSMQESSQAVPQFGPSDRAPHPEWQMVRSNDPVVPPTTKDHTLNEAIQASLQDFKEDTDMSPFKNSIREGNRPIALRPQVPSLAYAALALQALFYVPQVRSTVSNLRLPKIDNGAALGDPDRAMWNLIELFTNMDLAQLSALIDIELIPSLEILPYDGRGTLPEASANVVRNIGELIEEHLAAQTPAGEDADRLFTFTHGQVTFTLSNGVPSANRVSPITQTGMVVSVEFGGNSLHNDLISCIADHLNEYTPRWTKHSVIITPSEVISFQLKRLPNPPGSTKPSPDPFVYPKTIYLDRFLFGNLDLTNRKKRQEMAMLKQIKDLKAHKEVLTQSDGKNSLQSLEATIYYYEKVADPGDDPARKRTLKRVADHLKDIMTMVRGKVEDIDHQVEKLQAEVANIYDCPELQECRYDLRAVLVHTGLPGRKQMYSYVQDVEGTWWKTVDHDVTEVPEETVLTDPTGLHLGAGPYLLVYSRHLSDEQLHEPLIWPNIFSESVAINNKHFLAMMHPELGIFSMASPEVQSAPPPPPLSATTRELPIPQTREEGRCLVRIHGRCLWIKIWIFSILQQSLSMLYIIISDLYTTGICIVPETDLVLISQRTIA